MIHFGSNMAPKEDDVSRLKILLSEGHSLTDAAKIMEVSRSTAQRLKKKIKDSSPAENQKLDLVYGILENATTLLLTGQSMKQALDWSKTIYWNYHYICQERGQHWNLDGFGDNGRFSCHSEHPTSLGCSFGR